MWFVDIICNLEWFESACGNLGQPRLKQALPSGTPGVTTTLCLYGTETKLTHARVLMNVGSYAEADQLSNSLVAYWASALAIATGLSACEPLRPEVFPGTNSYALVLGEGDELEPSVTLTTPVEQPIDLVALAACLASWRPDAPAHLFFLAKFLDSSLPLEVRWLNGYRLCEWHFQRGKTGLAGNPRWRELLEQFRSGLSAHLKAGQSPWGFMEQTRALVAHALLDSRPVDQRLAKPGDPIVWSFAVMERLVLYIANLPELNLGLVTLKPTT